MRALPSRGVATRKPAKPRSLLDHVARDCLNRQFDCWRELRPGLEILPLNSIDNEPARKFAERASEFDCLREANGMGRVAEHLCRQGLGTSIKAPDGTRFSARTHGVNHHGGFGLRKLFHQGYALAFVRDHGGTFGQSVSQALSYDQSCSIIVAIRSADTDDENRVGFHRRCRRGCPLHNRRKSFQQ